MTTFATRRWTAGVITAVVSAAILATLLLRYPSLRDAAYFSGWTLLGICVFLTLYNLRKKFAYPPMLTSVVWLQLHVWVGAIAFLLFLVHIDLAWPNGPFEVTFALLFLGVIGTGYVGIILTRAIPPRLSVRGEEVIFERIPLMRRQLRERAEELVVTTVEETNATILTDFYARRLADFFRRPRNFWRHVFQVSGPREQLLAELRSLDHFFNDGEKAGADELAEIIFAKDCLDYHIAMQGLLKGWLFVHIPLTYLMLVFLAVHTVVVYTFVGSGS